MTTPTEETNRLTGTEEAEDAVKNFLNKDRRKKNPDLRITVGRPKEHHGLEIVETYQEVDKMTPEQVETHKETISRILFTNELKLHHKTIMG